MGGRPGDVLHCAVLAACMTLAREGCAPNRAELVSQHGKRCRTARQTLSFSMSNCGKVQLLEGMNLECRFFLLYLWLWACLLLIAAEELPLRHAEALPQWRPLTDVADIMVRGLLF